MNRFECLEALAKRLDEELVIANLANTSTEWKAIHPREGNLYFTGMGMVTPYALGLALAQPNRKIIGLDGDGGLLFDLSILGTIAQLQPVNLTIIVFDNGGYVSTGRYESTQTLTSGTADLAGIARACGITHTTRVDSLEAFVAAVEAADADEEHVHVIVARIDHSQAFVGTLLIDSKENKYRFMRHLEALEGRKLLRPSDREHGVKPRPDPASAPVGPERRFAEVLHEGLRENDLDFVVGLPCSGMSQAQQLCIDDPAIQYVAVAHEGTGFGICAGAWLGGKRPTALIENLGVFAGAYQLLRGHYSYGIPTLLIPEYRGDTGDTEFFGECGDMTEPMLSAMRINYQRIEDLGQLKPAIRDAWRWMNFGLRPFAVLPRFSLTRHRA